MRGVTLKLIALEEAATIPYELFSVILVPLLMVAGTTVVGVTSPGQRDQDLVSVLATRCNKDGVIFDIVNRTLICDQCLMLGRTSCEHREGPEWKSRDRVEALAPLTGQSDDPSAHLRENLGVNISTGSHAIPRDDLDWLRSARPVPITEADTKSIIIVEDPAGGGASQCAIGAYACTKHGILMVGGDVLSSEAGMPEYRALTTQFLHAVRRRFPDSLITFAMESNLSRAAATDMTIDMMRRPELAPFHAFADATAKNDRNYGFSMTADRKHAAVGLMREACSNGHMGRIPNMISVLRPDGESDKSYQLMVEQLGAIRRVSREPNGLQDDSRKRLPKWTAKPVPGMSGVNDDLAMTALIAIYATRYMAYSDVDFAAVSARTLGVDPGTRYDTYKFTGWASTGA